MIKPSKPVALIVEDEPLILMLAEVAFVDAGFVVLKAESADEALSIYITQASVDILFTDVNLPGEMDGIDLAESLIQLDPRLPIIITSALPIVRCVDHLSANFVSKPYSPIAVGAVARELLGGESRKSSR